MTLRDYTLIAAIQPVHLYAYQDHTIKTQSRKKATLDHEVLSHLFTSAPVPINSATPLPQPLSCAGWEFVWDSFSGSK